MDELKSNELLNEEIIAVLNDLEGLDPSTDQYKKTADNLATLYKLKIDEDKNINDCKDQKFYRVGNWIVDGAGIVLPLIFYGIWMQLGFKFEEKGVIASPTFKGLINKFKPTRR